MEIAHAHLAEIPGVVFVEICSVVVLPTGHTAPAGVFAMFSYTAVASGDVTAACDENVSQRPAEMRSWVGMKA